MGIALGIIAPIFEVGSTGNGVIWNKIASLQRFLMSC